VPAAARAWRADVGQFFGDVSRRRRDTKQLTGASEAHLAGGAGEQAVMADAVEAVGQDMQQEAADEIRRQSTS
jgi:hypothetical protein